MKLSMHATSILAAVFAVLCLVFGINGLMSLGDIQDAARLSDAKGFAWFWTFLGVIGLIVALFASHVARSIGRTANDADDDGELT